MSEKQEYQHLKKNMPQGHDRLDRIENIAGIGTPDINYCIEGVEGWIEMKSARERSRPNSKLLKHKLIQGQMNWFLKQRNAKGRAYILIATDLRWILIDGRFADRINDFSVGQLLENADWWSRKPVPNFSWNALRDVLRGKL